MLKKRFVNLAGLSLLSAVLVGVWRLQPQRKKTLGLSLLSASVVGAAAPVQPPREVQAQPRAVKNAGLTIRVASDEPVAGYEKRLFNKTQVVYVAPVAALTSADIVSATEVNGTLTVQLTTDAAARIAAEAFDRLAFFFDGHPMAAALALPAADPDTIEFRGLLPGQTQRLARLISGVSSAPVGPTLTAVSREIEVPADGTTTVDVFVTGVNEIRAYQVALDVNSTSAGQLELRALTVDVERPDYVFAGQQAVNAADETQGRLVAALYAGSVAVKEQSYLGTYTFHASADAQGSFEIQVRTVQDTLLRDAEGLPIGFQAGAPATVKVGRVHRPSERH